MKVIQLHAENFKRLGVVEISPEGSLITIGGNNGHGKSSVLDAIYVGLKGRAVAPPKPIRKGEERCVIRLDLGEIVVTRVFTAKEDGDFTQAIKVENGAGLRYGKPQEVLDALLGEVGFDPFEFVKLKPKDQAARLLEMVPLSIDLDEFRELDASDFAKRTEVNREVAALKSQIEAQPVEDAPKERPDKDAIADRLGNAANTNAAIDRERFRRIALGGDVETMRRTAEQDRARAAELQAEADRLAAAATQKIADAVAQESRAVEHQAVIDELPPLDEPEDTDALREELRAAEAALAVIERQTRRAALVGRLQEKTEASKALTDALSSRAAERNKALAEAEMPVEGLAFAIDERGEATLMFDGLPFERDQISTAAQLRVSTAIGMAANPRLRVLRIMDGSLLDQESMRLLAEMAEAEDFQLWVEVVGDGGVGIVMENGLVRGAAEGEAGAEAQAGTEPAAEAKPKKGKTAAKPKDEEKLI